MARAIQDTDFAVSLLQASTRPAALSDPDLGLTPAQQAELHTVLGEIAGLSFEAAMLAIKNEGVNDFR
ncbi:MAG TPA: hypothetical protein VK402_15950 [Blastococcus sp.]|nr:hypothetical protein [Blastococcus sp.]